MTEHHFETHRPVDLYVEIGKRQRHRRTPPTPPRPTSRSAAATPRRSRVEQEGDQISVIAPKQRGRLLRATTRLDVAVTLPDATATSPCAPAAPTSAVERHGRRRAQLKSGSGDVQLDDRSTGPRVVETGSGDIRVDEARGDAADQERLRRRRRRRAAAGAAVSTGSGDVGSAPPAARPSSRPAPATSRSARRTRRRRSRTGSGDLVVDDAAPRPGHASRAPPATSRSASRPACRCGPTSRP